MDRVNRAEHDADVDSFVAILYIAIFFIFILPAIVRAAIGG